MSIFTKKPEVNFKDFCRNFYDNRILYPIVGKTDFGGVGPEYVKKSLTEVDSDFEKVDSLKLRNEILNLRFELFALAWLHKFGEKSAIAQSIFTKNYLQEKGKIEIWNGMEHYNKAISHSVTAGLGDVNKAFWLRARADIAEKYISDANKKGIIVDDSLGLPINRLFSEKAWKKEKTSYFLMLGLCHKLGLGYGPDYHGPKDEAQFRLMVFIIGFYDGAMQSWGKVKIIGF